jgi:ribosome-binding factor A
MSKKRQDQVGRSIHRELSSILQKEGFSIYGKALVTVTEVVLNKDLSVAHVYLSVYNTDEKDTVIEKIKYHASEIRNGIGQALKNSMRHIPELRFDLDDTLDRVFRMEEIFKDIKKDKPDEPAE